MARPALLCNSFQACPLCPCRRNRRPAHRAPGRRCAQAVRASAMGTRAVLQAFERYQRERVAFAAGVVEMAKGPQVPPCAPQPQRTPSRAPYLCALVL